MAQETEQQPKIRQHWTHVEDALMNLAPGKVVRIPLKEFGDQYKTSPQGRVSRHLIAQFGPGKFHLRTGSTHLYIMRWMK